MNLPHHSCLCGLMAARSAWDAACGTWSPPYGRPQEPEGQLGPGCLAPTAMTVGGSVWGLALGELPAESCLLLAKTGSLEGKLMPRDLILSCQNRESCQFVRDL